MCERYSSRSSVGMFCQALRFLQTGADAAVEFRAQLMYAQADTVRVIVRNDDGRRPVVMRWDLVPNWWSKPLKDMRMPTFSARAETVAEKPFFRDALLPQRAIAGCVALS